ncbi:MAG: hypothetical protein JXQ23_00775 [Clostridia bacterium]|nr:hypothetical protein [Clostridia bacterium]
MRKLIFPLIFAILFIAVVIVYALAVLSAPAPLFLKWGLGILILLAAPAMVYAFIQRVKEFKEEEKDDISKY